jgi:hypothetical protein
MLKVLTVKTGISRRANRQIGRFELGDCLARRLGFRANSDDSSLGQNVLGGLVDTPAQNDIERRRFGSAFLPRKQIDMLDITRIGIEKKQMLGMGQMWFDT